MGTSPPHVSDAATTMNREKGNRGSGLGNRERARKNPPAKPMADRARVVPACVSSSSLSAGHYHEVGDRGSGLGNRERIRKAPLATPTADRARVVPACVSSSSLSAGHYHEVGDRGSGIGNRERIRKAPLATPTADRARVVPACVSSSSLSPIPDPLSPRRRRGFTLIELLITVSIIAIMASMILFALYRAQETAKAHKTRALIAKLDQVIKDKWQTYQYRRVPIYLGPDKYNDLDMDGQWDPGEPFTYDRYNNNTYDAAPTPVEAARMRLDALRDLMRMELPDRWTDITDGPATPFEVVPAQRIARPALSQTFLRRYNAAQALNTNWPTGQYAGAECLYLIVMTALASDEDSRDVFKPDNIRDLDGDSMPEFVDGWGQPIKFLRWAPGFQESELQITAHATASAAASANSLNISGAGVSSAQGSYVGSAVMGLTAATSGSPSQPVMIDTSKLARVSGYSPTTSTLTLNGTPPSITGNVVLTAPDPFDSRGVYAASLTPSFAPLSIDLFSRSRQVLLNCCRFWYGICASLCSDNSWSQPVLSHNGSADGPRFADRHSTK